MNELTWVAHASRDRELSLPGTHPQFVAFFPTWHTYEKFVAVEHRDQQARRVRYPGECNPP